MPLSCSMIPFASCSNARNDWRMLSAFTLQLQISERDLWCLGMTDECREMDVVRILVHTPLQDSIDSPYAKAKTMEWNFEITVGLPINQILELSVQ